MNENPSLTEYRQLNKEIANTAMTVSRYKKEGLSAKSLSKELEKMRKRRDAINLELDKQIKKQAKN